MPDGWKDLLTRRRLAAGGAVALAAMLVGWLLVRGASSDATGAYVTVPVDRGPVVATVAATGTVNPVATVQVGTYVSGPIQALFADYNSKVTKGQRVAKIDPAPFTVKVREADANLATARARVDKDRADLEYRRIALERLRGLVAKQAVSKDDVDSAESNHAQAVAQLALDEAAVKQAEASLDEAQVNLNYTDIMSPVDGVVVSRNVDVGQTVAASFQTPTLFLIAVDLTKMQVDTSVSESDIGHVALEQDASFTVDAYPGMPFHGVVHQIRNAPITVQNVVTYDVVVAVDNPKLELKPGMTASVTITTARRDDVLRVPLRALRFRPANAEPRPKRGEGEKAGPGVFVLGADGALRRVAVKTGVRDAEHVEVVSGELTVGDAVAVGGGPTPAATAERPAGPPSFAGGRRF